MTQEIYWELLAWLFRSFLAVTTFAFVVAGYQAVSYTHLTLPTT